MKKAGEGRWFLGLQTLPLRRGSRNRNRRDSRARAPCTRVGADAYLNKELA